MVVWKRRKLKASVSPHVGMRGSALASYWLHGFCELDSTRQTPQWASSIVHAAMRSCCNGL